MPPRALSQPSSRTRPGCRRPGLAGGFGLVAVDPAPREREGDRRWLCEAGRAGPHLLDRPQPRAPGAILRLHSLGTPPYPKKAAIPRKLLFSWGSRARESARKTHTSFYGKKISPKAKFLVPSLPGFSFKAQTLRSLKQNETSARKLCVAFFPK